MMDRVTNRFMDWFCELYYARWGDVTTPLYTREDMQAAYEAGYIQGGEDS